MSRPTRRLRPAMRFRVAMIEGLEERALLSTITANHRQPVVAAQVVPIHHGANLQAARHAATAAKSRAHPMLVIAPGAQPNLGGPPASALTPAQTRHIYGFDQIANLGAGQTIAIVDAYDDPNIFADADTFDKKFKTTLSGTTSYYAAYGASTSWLSEAYPQGSKPASNGGWAQEISLDVEWMHAIAPQAKIVLVEAANNSTANLLAANVYSANTVQATVVSNSWGGGESSGEIANDQTFTGHHGVTFVFSAGDSGNQEYAAESPDVVAVGGTSLSHDTAYNWTGEAGWSGGGGGVSAYEAKPSYQSALPYAKRANPDISYDADPNTGFAVYDSLRYAGRAGWAQFGGTSAGAPQWAALIGLANQGRVAHGGATLDGITQTLPALYAMSSTTDGTGTLYDVTTGANKVGSAGPGYDLVTGKGAPRKAQNVYNALVSY